MLDLIREILNWLARLRAPMPDEVIYEESREAATVPDAHRLSANFVLAEFTRSATAQAQGIDNTPSLKHVANLRQLARTLERVREALGGHPIIISSGYRSPELNRVVGGSPTSDHANGLAVDFTCPGFGSAREVCEAIVAAGIEFDQLIYEQGNTEWVHLGIGTRLRGQVMSWSRQAGYVNGIRRLA